jgi:hypothetical protein
MTNFRTQRKRLLSLALRTSSPQTSIAFAQTQLEHVTNQHDSSSSSSSDAESSITFLPGTYAAHFKARAKANLKAKLLAFFDTYELGQPLVACKVVDLNDDGQLR